MDIVEFHNFELTCTEVCDSLSDVRHEITRHWMFTSFESKEIKVRRHAVRDCVHVREALRDIGQGVLFLGKLCFIKHGFTFDSINESSIAITEMRKTYFEDVFFDHNFRRAKELWDHLSDSDYEDQPSEYSVPSESDTSEDIPHYAIEARGAHFFYYFNKMFEDTCETYDEDGNFIKDSFSWMLLKDSEKVPTLAVCDEHYPRPRRGRVGELIMRRLYEEEYWLIQIMIDNYEFATSERMASLLEDREIFMIRSTSKTFYYSRTLRYLHQHLATLALIKARV